MTYLNLGGTHRAKTAAETLQIAKTIGKEIGITRAANITGLDSVGIPVVTAIRPNAKLLAVSQGKGATLELAKVSALMESIEIWHAENIPLPDLKGAYKNLSDAYRMIDPCHIAHSIFDVKTLRELSLHWCRGINLIDHQIYYIPHEAVSLDSTKPSEANLLFGTTSNGLASGNTRAEAACHALCELVERDAYAKFNHLSEGAQNTRLLDLKSIDGPSVRLFLTQLQKASINVQVWDITSDIGLPAFCCNLLDEDISRNTQVFSGQGCHFDKETAICRAITEAAQTRLTFIAGSRDDVFPSYYEKKIFSADALMTHGTHHYHDVPQPVYKQNFEENLKMIVALLFKKNYQHIILLEHTYANYPIAVVQVIIPHLSGKDD
jgi:YcaO-like protein with predicted kinase domain